MLALATLSSCGGGGVDGGTTGGGPPRTRTHVADASSTAASRQHHRRHHHTAPPASPGEGEGDDPASNPPEGAALGESLRFRDLEVRALDYRKAGFDGAATGTRVDVVTVEECADGGSARVQHRTWRLVDAEGRTLGVAGGKIVNGNPTEDLPEVLSPGQCVTTMLVIGVPAGAEPTTVQDGPDAVWVLTG